MKNLFLASAMAIAFTSVAYASDEAKTEAPPADAAAQATAAPEATQQPAAEGAKTETAPESK